MLHFLKKLLARWQHVVELGRYRLDNFFTRGVSAQFVVLLVLMLGLILLGTLGLSLGLYAPENKDIAAIGHKFDEGFWDAVWWSMMHIFDASYVSQDYGATPGVVILALVISMLGLVLFGGVIGLISAGVERKFSELAAGNRPVRETGHLLILGWNDKIFSILDLFEDYHKPVTIAILANHTIADMQEQLRTARTNIRRIKPILRTGSPTNLSELERMAFQAAYSIIVLADESHPNQEEEADICTIKTLMLLASNLPPAPPRPKMVAELQRQENLEVARIASRRSISLICSGEVLSRMIVQAARQPGLSTVYSSLFGFADNEIFIQPQPECTGRRFADLRFDFPNAIALGTSSMEMRDGRPYFQQHINPAKEHVVGKEEWLILLSRGAVLHQPAPAAPPGPESVPPPGRNFARERVLILGWNSNIYTILHEYDTFLQAGSEITIAALHEPEKAHTLLADHLHRPLVNATSTYVQTDYALSDRLEALLAHSYDTCIILADQSSGERDPDARAIVTILLLQDYDTRHPQHPFKQIVAEVLAAANSELLQHHGKTDTIISPRLISMLLAQVSQQLMLERVYADLMNAHANEIYLKPVRRYTPQPANCTFADLMRAAAELGELALGVKRKAEAGEATKDFGIRINPPKDTPLALTDHDEVIVVSNAEHPPGA